MGAEATIGRSVRRAFIVGGETKVPVSSNRVTQFAMGARVFTDALCLRCRSPRGGSGVTGQLSCCFPASSRVGRALDVEAALKAGIAAVVVSDCRMPRIVIIISRFA